MDGFSLSLSLVFLGIPGWGWALFVVAWLTEAFLLWYFNVFGGVPHDAKTLGLGWWCLKSQDPIAQVIGANLWGGGKSDRVISESTGTCSFEAIIVALGSSLIELANYLPGKWPWTTIAGPASYKHWWILGPTAPPPGAPYTQDVQLGPFWSNGPLTVAQYQAKFGFLPPTPTQWKAFLESKWCPNWTQIPSCQATVDELVKDALNIVAQKWRLFMPPPPPPPPPNPPDYTPILTAIQNCICGTEQAQQGFYSTINSVWEAWRVNLESTLTTLTEYINEINYRDSTYKTPFIGRIADDQDAIRTTIGPGLIGALNSIATALSHLGGGGGGFDPNVALELKALVTEIPTIFQTWMTQIVAQITRVANESTTQATVVGPQIVAQLTAIAAKLSVFSGGFDPNVAVQLKRIADDLDKLAGSGPMDPADKALVQLFVSRGTIEPSVGQVLLT